VHAIRRRFPRALFAVGGSSEKNHAIRLPRIAYRKELPSFTDDIQGEPQAASRAPATWRPNDV